MRKDQSEATVAEIDLGAENCLGVGDALTRKPTAVGTFAPASTTTRPETEAPGPNTNARSSRSRSCTSMSFSANSPVPSVDSDDRVPIVNRYQPGGTRA